MSTTKKTVSTALQQIAQSEQIEKVVPPAKKHGKLLIALLIICLLFTIIFLARVPYIGSYVDTYVFELVFGWAKFIIYLWLIVGYVLLLFKIRFKKHWWSFKTIISVFLLWLVISLSITIYFVVANHTHGINNYLDYFKSWAKDTKYNHYIFNDFTPDGGIISLLLIKAKDFALCLVLGIIVLMIIIVIVLLTIYRYNRNGINRIKQWFIKKITGTKMPINDTLAVNRNDPRFTPAEADTINQQARLSDFNVPPLSLLPNTNIDNYFENKSISQSTQELIKKILSSLNIEAKPTNVNIMPSFTEFGFSLKNQSDFENISKNHHQFLDISPAKQFNILCKRNNLTFEIPNRKPSKISIKQVITVNQKVDYLYSVIGLTKNNETEIVDYKQHPITMLIGKNGSGRNMLLSCMLLSTIYLNTPLMLEVVLFDLNNEKFITKLAKTPHVKDGVLNNLSTIEQTIDDLINKANQRMQIFATNKCNDIYQYNKKQKTQSSHLSFVIVAMLDFDIITRTNPALIAKIQTLLSIGQKVGFYYILTTQSINLDSTNPLIYKNIKYKFVLKLASEQESISVLDSTKAWHLFGSGDGYIINNGKETRFQSCYLNIVELEEIVRIINTFYGTKQQIA